MPEAAMHEDDRFVFWKHDVRFAGQVFTVKAEPVTHVVEHRTNEDFRLRIGTSNPRHVPTAMFLRETIHSRSPNARASLQADVSLQDVAENRQKAVGLVVRSDGYAKTGQLGAVE